MTPTPPAQEIETLVSHYFNQGRCSGHSQFNWRYCRDVAGPEQWCINCAGFMLLEQLTSETQARQQAERDLQEYQAKLGDARFKQAVAEQARAQAEQERANLLSILHWALGQNGSFPVQPDAPKEAVRAGLKGRPLYWWRSEMRQRMNAALLAAPRTGEGTMAQAAEAPARTP